MTILIVGIMVLSGLGAVAVSSTKQTVLKQQETISFSQPIIEKNNGYTLIRIPDTNSWLRTQGAPMLPAQISTFIYPFGTKITNVEVTFSEPQIYKLETEIMRTPQPVTLVDGKTITLNTEPINLGSLYPEKPFDYHLGAGVSNEQHVIYLTIQYYPISYKPIENTIQYSKETQITISYQPPVSQPVPTADFKLLIVAPKEFVTALQPLVDYKISKGLTTKLVTIDDICTGTNFTSQGRDCAEKLKYFIKDALEQWGTQYVLLVGGRSGGILKEKWWVPVRYTNLEDGANWEGGYLSDLYFADIYDATGNFSTWDSNGNGLFAEWNNQGKDKIDMYPDLSVGRLACVNTDEVTTVVNKIITYETTTAGKDWFKKMVVVGGDSAPSASDPWYEGEEENKLALEYMNGFTGTKLWTSTQDFTGPNDVINAIDGGCGFLYFDGHGNPKLWSTHPPKNESTWIDGLSVNDMPNLNNGERLPVCICGGCHNGQFNTSIGMLFKGLIQEKLKYFQWTYWLWEWIPECWAWKLVSVKNGGSIATIANTALDWFSEGDGDQDGIPDAVQYLSGYMNTQFFKNYGVNHITTLGKTHTQALTDYLNTFPPMNDKLDCKTVQEYTLFGDPSLIIGGYS